MSGSILNIRRTLLTHPLPRKLALASLIAIGIGVLRGRLGDHSLLGAAIGGLGAYIFADWLLSSRSERVTWNQRVATFIREHWRKMALLASYILMFTYFTATQSEPSDPAVHEVYSLVNRYGLLGLFLTMVVAGAINILAFDRSAPFSQIPIRLMAGVMYYSIALWLIGNAGDALYQWVIDHPDNAAVGGVAFVIIWAIVQLSGVLSFERRISARTPDRALSLTTEPTERDNRYTAAHEAGHALVYAALGGLPADVHLVVNDRVDDGVLGFITNISTKHQLDSKSFAEWYMMVLLAGRVGESVMYGEMTLGSSNDHQRWLEMAQSYLANHYRGIYYMNPTGTLELAQNEAKLQALQDEQRAMLHTLFDMNTDVFKHIADTLLTLRKMGRDDLIPFLSRVKLPEGFPLPFGPFETFASGWQDLSDS